MYTIRDWMKAIESAESPECIAVAFADWLDEAGDVRADKVRENAGSSDYCRQWCLALFEQDTVGRLAGYNWREAFAYAGREMGCNQGRPERALPNDTDTSVEPFSRFDIKRLIAASEGENDRADWLAVGELYDGRFFALAAGCDYTGWD